MIMVDKKRLTDVIYLDFCSTFSMNPHDILIFKLETYGFDGWTTQWLRNWLDGCSHRDVANDSMSSWRSVTSGVPSGFCLRTDVLQYLHSWSRGTKCTLSRFADDKKLSNKMRCHPEGHGQTWDISPWESHGIQEVQCAAPGSGQPQTWVQTGRISHWEQLCREGAVNSWRWQAGREPTECTCSPGGLY